MSPGGTSYSRAIGPGGDKLDDKLLSLVPPGKIAESRVMHPGEGGQLPYSTKFSRIAQTRHFADFISRIRGSINDHIPTVERFFNQFSGALNFRK